MKIYRIAKIAEAPPAMVEDIYSAINEYNSSEKARNGEIALITIPIDLNGWVYGGNELLEKLIEKSKEEVLDTWEMIENSDKSDKDQERLKSLFFGNESANLDDLLKDKAEGARELKLVLYPSPDNPRDLVGAPSESQPANYMPALNRISIYTKAPVNLLKRFIQHELIHFVQSMFERMHGSKGFMPSKRGKGRNDPYKRPESREEYLLMDEEYQTWLHDTAELLKEHYAEKIAHAYYNSSYFERNFTPQQRINEIFYDFKRTNEFLNVLKRRSPEKYKEAISELYRLIHELERNRLGKEE
jgi:DNA-directed RNA polymerase subunit F